MCKNSDISQILTEKSIHEEENSITQETKIEVTVERNQEIQPHENDILMGRGGKNNQHVGNEKLRSLARLESKKYRMASKSGKSCISRNLVQLVRCMSPPGRFLKKNSTTGIWEDVGDNVAREKASQALRDAVSILIHPSPDESSQVKIDPKEDKKFDNLIPRSKTTTTPTQPGKRRHWESFTCNDLSQHIVSNSVYHQPTPSSNHELSPKRLKYNTITWDEHLSHMTQFPSNQYSISADRVSTHPVIPRLYSQKTYPKYYTSIVSEECIQKYTAINEFDLFNDEILDCDQDVAEKDEDFNENNIVDVFDFDQSQISEGITAKIWPVCV